MGKTLFIAAGPLSWGSSRMRAYWPAKHMDADAMTLPEALEKNSFDAYNTIVWQKVFNLELAEQLKGKRQLYDACDPVWWFAPEEAESVFKVVDGVVCSNDGLSDDLDEWLINRDLSLPVTTIPDSIDLSHFPIARIHTNVTPVRLIWFGVAVNRIGLTGAITGLERAASNGHKIELTIFDEAAGNDWSGMVERFPVYHVKWSLDRENEVIANHDIAILPPYPGMWGKVKSNNKNMTALACGVPTSDGCDYAQLSRLISDPEYRKASIMDVDFLQYESMSVAKLWEAVCSS